MEMGYGKKLIKKIERMLINTYVRTMYAEGLSSLVMSHYNTNLSFCFNRWIEKDIRGIDVYDTSNGLSTTLNYENASFLSLVARHIIEDINPDNELKAVLQCNNATLVFEYKHENSNKMAAYLTINKNNQSISHKFITDEYQEKKNDQIVVTKVVQAGVNVLAEVLHGYLSGIASERHLEKLADYYDASKGEYQQKSNGETGNSNGYQNGAW